MKNLPDHAQRLVAEAAALKADIAVSTRPGLLDRLAFPWTGRTPPVSTPEHVSGPLTRWLEASHLPYRMEDADMAPVKRAIFEALASLAEGETIGVIINEHLPEHLPIGIFPSPHEKLGRFIIVRDAAAQEMLCGWLKEWNREGGARSRDAGTPVEELMENLCDRCGKGAKFMVIPGTDKAYCHPCYTWWRRVSRGEEHGNYAPFPE